MPFLFGSASPTGTSAPVVQVFRRPSTGGPLRSIMDSESENSDDGGISGARPWSVAPPSRVQQPVLPAGISTIRIKMTMIEEVIQIVRSGSDKIPGPRLPSLPMLDYVCHKDNPWCGVFYTSMPRDKALKTLKDLNLPVGGPEPDERDSWLGLYAREDMKPGWSDEHAVKDLDYLWKQLSREHGMNFNIENTVVITSNPAHMIKQPQSFILVPAFEYLSTIPPDQDTVLLQLIAALDDLLTETNFPFHIKQFKWDQVDTWAHVQGKDSAAGLIKRAFMVKAAVSICAMMRIPIVAFEGNFKWKTALRSDYALH
ncbi:hypothetical protein OIV83_002616 [Microbotryomycetes sp. JL201]|nr:hypothetical protein OIV83_002616 [Microbotryomycetes sp. JL201]